MGAEDFNMAILLVAIAISCVVGVIGLGQFAGLFRPSRQVLGYRVTRAEETRLTYEYASRARKEVLVVPRPGITRSQLAKLENTLRQCGRLRKYDPYIIAFVGVDELESSSGKWSEDDIVAFVSSAPQQAFVVIDRRTLIMMPTRVPASGPWDVAVYENDYAAAEEYAEVFHAAWASAHSGARSVPRAEARFAMIQMKLAA